MVVWLFFGVDYHPNNKHTGTTHVVDCRMHPACVDAEALTTHWLSYSATIVS